MRNCRSSFLPGSLYTNSTYGKSNTLPSHVTHALFPIPLCVAHCFKTNSRCLGVHGSKFRPGSDRFCCLSHVGTNIAYQYPSLFPFHSRRGLCLRNDYARGGYLGQFLLDMCRWPLRAPTPLWSILWPVNPIQIGGGGLFEPPLRQNRDNSYTERAMTFKFSDFS